MSKLREFQDAVLTRNVLARAVDPDTALVSRVASRSVESKAFPSKDALEAYLKEHPGADKSKHHVEDAETSKVKKDLKDFQKIQKGQQKSEKGKADRKHEKGKKEDDAHAEKLKKELTDWKDAK